MTNEEAVDNAIERCISEGILVDYLTKKKADVKRMHLQKLMK